MASKNVTSPKVASMASKVMSSPKSSKKKQNARWIGIEPSCFKAVFQAVFQAEVTLG